MYIIYIHNSCGPSYIPPCAITQPMWCITTRKPPGSVGNPFVYWNKPF